MGGLGGLLGEIGRYLLQESKTEEEFLFFMGEGSAAGDFLSLSLSLSLNVCRIVSVIHPKPVKMKCRKSSRYSVGFVF